MTSIIKYHFYFKLQFKLFSYFDQNVYFYLENREAVTVMIISASSRTSQYKLAMLC